jgi:hypothetical protein
MRDILGATGNWANQTLGLPANFPLVNQHGSVTHK